jgi:hypothetical protein
MLPGPRREARHGSVRHKRICREKGAGIIRADKALARRLGLEVVDLPGGHLGFMAAPAAFAEALLMALKDD